MGGRIERKDKRLMINQNPNKKSSSIAVMKTRRYAIKRSYQVHYSIFKLIMFIEINKGDKKCIKTKMVL